MSVVTFRGKDRLGLVEVVLSDDGVVVTGHGKVGAPDRQMLDFLFDRLESYRQMLEKEEDRLEEEAERQQVDEEMAAVSAQIQERLRVLLIGTDDL